MSAAPTATSEASPQRWLTPGVRAATWMLSRSQACSVSGRDDPVIRPPSLGPRASAASGGRAKLDIEDREHGVALDWIERNLAL